MSSDMAGFNEEFADWLKKLIERILQDALSKTNGKELNKKWLTPAEFAAATKRAPYTVREWCRYGRINASKRACGRGNAKEWMIPSSEIERFGNDGLLPKD